MSAATLDVISRIDWALLSNQKQWLLEQRPNEYVDGLVALLDALQDAETHPGEFDD